MPKTPNFPYRTGRTIVPFDKYASATVAPGATAVLFEFEAPAQIKRGYITLLGHGVADPAAIPLSVWRIEINSVPVNDYNNIQDILGEFKQPEEIGPVIVQPGQRVRLIAVNNNAVAYLYGGRLRGFWDFEGA